MSMEFSTNQDLQGNILKRLSNLEKAVIRQARDINKLMQVIHDLQPNHPILNHVVNYPATIEKQLELTRTRTNLNEPGREHAAANPNQQYPMNPLVHPPSAIPPVSGLPQTPAQNTYQSQTNLLKPSSQLPNGQNNAFGLGPTSFAANRWSTVTALKQQTQQQLATTRNSQSMLGKNKNAYLERINAKTNFNEDDNPHALTPGLDSMDNSKKVSHQSIIELVTCFCPCFSMC